MLIRQMDETAELLKWVQPLWSYAPHEGQFRWMEQPGSEFEPSANMTARRNMLRWNGSYAGVLAGTCKPDRPRLLSRKGLVMRAERVALALTHDKWPNGTVRFVDRDIANCKLENLTFTEGVWTR